MGIQMKFTAQYASLLLIFVSSTLSSAQNPDAKHGTVSIKQAVTLDQAAAKLNALTEDHTIGQDQPTLTADEIVAAINRWDFEAPISDEKREQFKTIAKTRMLNPGDKLQFSTGLWSDGHYFTVWWLDLTVDNYRFRIRDRTISSRPQTLKEHQQRTNRHIQ